MERELALLVGGLGLGRLVALVPRVEVALQDQLAVGHGPGVDGPGLDDANREALDRAGRAQLVAAARQDHVVEAAPGDERGRRREAEAHRQRNGPLIVVVLGDDLPHVGARRRLEGADVPPARVHPVVADVAAAVEVGPDDDAVAAADGPLRLELGVADRHDVLVDLEVVGDDLLLAGRVVLRDLHRGQGMGERVSQFAGPRHRRLPAEHPVDDIHVGEQVRDRPRGGVPFDVFEQDRTAAVQLLLHAGHLEVRIDRRVGFQEQILLLEPLQRAAQRLETALQLYRDCHGVSPSLVVSRCRIPITRSLRPRSAARSPRRAGPGSPGTPARCARRGAGCAAARPASRRG